MEYYELSEFKNKIIALLKGYEFENAELDYEHNYSMVADHFPRNNFQVLLNYYKEKQERGEIARIEEQQKQLQRVVAENESSKETQYQANTQNVKVVKQASCVEVEDIMKLIKDYREGEIEPVTSKHIERWINQFELEIQKQLLTELLVVLKETYYSKERVLNFLDAVIQCKELTGPNTLSFWGNANFLQIQKNGQSQKEMLNLFRGVMREKYNVDFTENAKGVSDGVYVYLDDAIFSGQRVSLDLEAWVRNSAPIKAIVHIVTIASHSLGQYHAEMTLKQTIAESKKNITIRFWWTKLIENRLRHKDTSQVLWPTGNILREQLVKKYLSSSQRFPFTPRIASNSHWPFSSEGGRCLLEREMLLAGLRIRNFCQNPSDALRPLGFSPFGLGFGSTVVTYRNCPNNCPLAFWWGDSQVSGPLTKWYPLFPRKTYEQ